MNPVTYVLGWFRKAKPDPWLPSTAFTALRASQPTMADRIASDLAEEAATNPADVVKREANVSAWARGVAAGIHPPSDGMSLRRANLIIERDAKIIDRDRRKRNKERWLPTQAEIDALNAEINPE